MTRADGRGRGPLRRLAPLVLAAALVAGCGSGATTDAVGPGAGGPVPAASPSAPTTASPGTGTGTSTGTGTGTVVDPGLAAAGAPQDPDLGVDSPLAARGVVPVRVTVPAIGVASDLETLALGADGRITPPVAWGSAGWYAGGVVPGDVGPAVVAGHVDGPDGPAVFVDLARLVPGDEVVVTLSDGTDRRFVVERSVRAPKADFPTAEVYSPTPDAQLRLITCDGVFDRRTGHYVDNLVVFAVPATP
ncbi:sortase domain-containing protein [Cellulomonas marina]|uniref:Sortase family protein n=1 Tax=Cellulomonas marina TaxID=988821 RepID=A0A1I1A0B8_9CELL|nr:sortase [Cellulomonas marina]GIG30295.1 hypothetical protein Cma02nite_28950 [Cellulomonas marina]SFB31424.1 Sortase family protein [Cellulomonas marina]